MGVRQKERVEGMQRMKQDKGRIKQGQGKGKRRVWKKRDEGRKGELKQSRNARVWDCCMNWS
jgi:hypothetical protein